MTQLDFIILALLAVSAAVGFSRGAVREIFALVALVAAAGLAVLGLPVFGPMVRGVISPPWLGTGLAVALVFVLGFVGLRLIGAGIARQVQSIQVLGLLDRSLGLLIGLARGLILLGAMFLAFHALTPKDIQPRWIVGAQMWPVARNMARLIESLIPQGLDAAGRLKPMLERAIRDGSGDRSKTEGYDARQPTAPERAR